MFNRRKIGIMVAGVLTSASGAVGLLRAAKTTTSVASDVDFHFSQWSANVMQTLIDLYSEDIPLRRVAYLSYDPNLDILSIISHNGWDRIERRIKVPLTGHVKYKDTKNLARLKEGIREALFPPFISKGRLPLEAIQGQALRQVGVFEKANPSIGYDARIDWVNDVVALKACRNDDQAMLGCCITRKCIRENADDLTTLIDQVWLALTTAIKHEQLPDGFSRAVDETERHRGGVHETQPRRIFSLG